MVKQFMHNRVEPSGFALARIYLNQPVRMMLPPGVSSAPGALTLPTQLSLDEPNSREVPEP